MCKMKKESIIFFSLFIIIILIFTSSSILAEEESSISEVNEKLTNISKEEREILEYLFIQVQEIEELERENHRTQSEIDLIIKEAYNIETRIEKEEKDYKKNLLALENVLKSYQKMGPASYLEIILESDSITNFIKRINVLRDLSRNVGELLDDIDLIKEKLISDKEELDEKLNVLEKKHEELEETLTKKQELVKEKEEYLESLKDDKEYYLEYLDYISMIMEQLKIVFNDFTKEFARLIEEGNFPKDSVKETITLKGIRGVIDEKTFNDVISAHKDIPQMEFKFYSGKLKMNAPEKNLILTGKFVILGDRILQFEPEEGSFYEMPLEKSTMKELFKEGYLVLNLEPLIGKNIIKDVEIKKGYIELLVIPKLF